MLATSALSRSQSEIAASFLVPVSMVLAAHLNLGGLDGYMAVSALLTAVLQAPAEVVLAMQCPESVMVPGRSRKLPHSFPEPSRYGGTWVPR